MMPRFLAPAGTPVSITQLLRASKAALISNGQMEGGLSSFATYLSVRFVFATSSGRSALCLILRSLHRLRPNRHIVAIPAYTCFSVAASVVRAGLKLHLVDMDAETLDLDYSQLEALPSDNLLCVITANLFGLINDVQRMQQIAHSKGAFLVDDAAQSLGSARGGDLSGTAGDVGFYSLARGKPLAAGEGGIVVTNSPEIAEILQHECSQLARNFLAEAQLFLKILINSVFLHPRLYWIPNAMPFLGLGTTEFAPSFPLKGIAKLAQILSGQLLRELTTLNAIRLRNATEIARALKARPEYIVPRPAPDCQPTYIRLPVIAKDQETRDRAVGKLRSAGIGASPFYPTAICDIHGIEQHMGAANFHREKSEALSRRLFTLPTHPWLAAADLERIVKVLCSNVRRS